MGRSQVDLVKGEALEMKENNIKTNIERPQAKLVKGEALETEEKAHMGRS